MAGCGEVSGKSRRCSVLQRGMRTGVVVIGDPRLDRQASVSEPEEQALIQQFITHAPVERFDIAVLHGLAWRDAKAKLSAIVDEAVRGKPAVITRHGKKEAVVLGYEEWQKLSEVPSFGRLLMSAPLAPEDIPVRDRKPIRDANL